MTQAFHMQLDFSEKDSKDAARKRSFKVMIIFTIYQNLQCKFGIEHHAYTMSHIDQISCVCTYVCMCV